MYLDDSHGEEHSSSVKGGGWRQQTLGATEYGDSGETPTGNSCPWRTVTRNTGQPTLGLWGTNHSPIPALSGERNWERWGNGGGKEVFSFCLWFWLPQSILPDNRLSYLSQVKSVLPMWAIGKWFPRLCLKLRDFPSYYFHLISWGGEGDSSWMGAWPLASAYPPVSSHT